MNNIVDSNTILSDDVIRKIIINRIHVRHQAVGIVAGVVGSNKQHIVVCGRFDEKDSQSPNGDTVFEIGSITNANKIKRRFIRYYSHTLLLQFKSENIF